MAAADGSSMSSSADYQHQIVAARIKTADVLRDFGHEAAAGDSSPDIAIKAKMEAGDNNADQVSNIDHHCANTELNNHHHYHHQISNGHCNLIDEQPSTTTLNQNHKQIHSTISAKAIKNTDTENNTAATEDITNKNPTHQPIPGIVIEHQEDHLEQTPDAQLSPNSALRRSSRVSALKAKQKLQQQINQTNSTNIKESQQSNIASATIGISTPTTAIVNIQPDIQQQQSSNQHLLHAKVKSTDPAHVISQQQTTSTSTECGKKTTTTKTKMVQEHNDDTVTTDVALLDPAVSASASYDEQTHAASALKKKLKRKLEDGRSLDQYDCKFGIRLDDHGEVVIMSDESEISSLNNEEVTQMRDRYERIQKQEVSEEVQLQRELQIRELESLLRAEEAKLLMMKKLRQSQQQHVAQKIQHEGIRRLAPGVVQNSSGQAYKPKVAIANQQSAATNQDHHNQTNRHQNAGSTGAKLNGSGGGHGGKKARGAASKTTVATDSNTAAQFNIGAIGAAGGIQLSTLPPQHLNVIQQLYERLSQNPQQMAHLIKTLPAPTGQALTELLRQYALAQTSCGGLSVANTAPQQQTAAATITKSTASHQQQQSTQGGVTSSASQALTQAQIDAAHKQARDLTQQNVNKARQQLRRELDQMIIKLPVPKAPPSDDLQFIPNGNQPDFAYLLGLDLAVQRVMKDKQMFRKSDLPPYQCEECEIDFTPSWKAICDENGDCHLYCERCIRQAQKKKVHQEYTKMWKNVFQTIKEREKEFERQVNAGKFNVEPVLPNPLPPPPPATVTNVKQMEKMTKVLQQQNNVISSTALSQAVKSNSGTAAMQHNQQQHQNAPPMGVLNLSKSTGGITPSTVMSNAALKNTSSAITTPQQKTAMGSKRAAATANTATTTPSINSTNSLASNSPLAALQNPLFQQQFAAMATLSNSPLLRQVSQMASNPLMLAAMTQNPMIMQQLFTMAAQQHQRVAQQQQTPPTVTTNNTATPNLTAASATLAQLAQRSSQAQQQQQHHTQQQHSHNRSSSHTTSTPYHNHTTPSSANTPGTGTSITSGSGSATNQQQNAQMASLAALMNSAANPFLAIQSLGASNPQLLTQLSTNPQFRQFLQMYMQQQMKAAGNTGVGAGKK